MTRALGALICRRAARARSALDSWEMEMQAFTATITRIIRLSTQSAPRLETRESTAAPSSTRIIGSFI